jgi:threonine/homoserine/homoserine lactone efflux protein
VYPDHVLAFLVVCAAVICTPGQDTALTIRNTLRDGRRGGVGTALGVASGQLVWALAVGTGLGALLVASETVFGVLRLAGALYLVALGLRAIGEALRRGGGRERAAAGAPRARAPAFRQGLLSNLANPKMAVFFLGLLPQFASPASSPLLLVALGAAFAALTLGWLVLYAVAVARARRSLARPRVRRALDAVTGTALVAVGLRVATER